MTDNEKYNHRLLQIKSELGNIPMPIVTIFMNKEMERLPHILEPEEKIIHAVTGNWKGKKHGLLTATDKRMIFLSYNLFNSFEERFSYENMSPLCCEQGILYGDIIIQADRRVVIKRVNNKNNAASFCNTVNTLLTRLTVSGNSGNAVPDSEDVYRLLESLGNLREKGILTEQEFAEQKKKLLDQL